MRIGFEFFFRNILWEIDKAINYFDIFLYFPWKHPLKHDSFLYFILCSTNQNLPSIWLLLMTN